MGLLSILFMFITYCPHIVGVFVAYALFEINTVAGVFASLALTFLAIYEVEAHMNRTSHPPICDMEVDRTAA